MRLDDPRMLRALIASIAPLGLLVGCGDTVETEEPEGPDFGEFEESLCHYETDSLSGLNPASDVDYLALRNVEDYGGEEDLEVQIMSEWGTACDTATDAMACATALAALPIDAALVTQSLQITVNYDVAMTRGDEVVSISDLSSLVAALGTIDTPNEAVLMAFANGHTAACSQANVRKEGDGYVILGTSGTTCGGNVSQYLVTVASDGTVTAGEKTITEYGDDNCAIGRRPDGLCSNTRRARSVGAFFANASHLEAASVYAFSQLARELVAHDAPRALVSAALRARADEIRHARTTARLARRFGVAPIKPVVGHRPVRNLFSVALDNATEGCVRETFGAATAHVQAQRAHSRMVRRAMKPIAVDETRHAMLSLAVDRWVAQKLSPGEQRAIAEQRQHAVAQLREESAQSTEQAIGQIAGMPTPDASLKMIDAMTPSLWRA